MKVISLLLGLVPLILKWFKRDPAQQERKRIKETVRERREGSAELSEALDEFESGDTSRINDFINRILRK